VANRETTWDGRPIAREPPYASCVVVWCTVRTGRQFLILHRLNAGGPDHHGDWAWTPPSGARLPGETPEGAAERELREETGLALPFQAIPEAAVSEDVALYVAEAPPVVEVVLDHEHDAFVWLTLDEAVAKCLPAEVGTCIKNAAAWLDVQLQGTS
jgi:8-oxo-dGTP pyrophosphatase MutT (NUDIX family)